MFANTTGMFANGEDMIAKRAERKAEDAMAEVCGKTTRADAFCLSPSA